MTSFARREAQQPGCNLFKLPSELRLMIYEILFPPDTLTPCAIKGVFRPSQESSNDHPVQESVGILATCQTLYAGARPVFFANNEFRVLIRDQEYFDSSIEFGEHEDGYPEAFTALKHVRKLSLDVGLYTLMFWEGGRGDAWLGQILAQIRNAPRIRSSHVLFEIERSPYLWSKSRKGRVFTRIVEIFKELSCSGDVTTTMGLSIGKNELDTSAYYDMLASIGGDMTRWLYATTMRNASDYREWRFEMLETTRGEQKQKQAELEKVREIVSCRGDDSAFGVEVLTKYVKRLTNEARLLQSVISRTETQLVELGQEVERQVGDYWPREEAA